jgi:DNA-directed RNA polymerase omega subunit
MDNDSFLYDVKIEGLTKYELVLVASRRAREINQMRIALEKKHDTRLIEKEKPTLLALQEILDGQLTYTHSKPGEEEEEQHRRGMKKTI